MKGVERRSGWATSERGNKTKHAAPEVCRQPCQPIPGVRTGPRGRDVLRAVLDIGAEEWGALLDPRRALCPLGNARPLRELVRGCLQAMGGVTQREAKELNKERGAVGRAVELPVRPSRDAVPLAHAVPRPVDVCQRRHLSPDLSALEPNSLPSVFPGS